MNEIKNKEMFLAMRDIFYGGEFSHWLNKQKMPFAAAKEYEEAMRYFEKQTEFDVEQAYKETKHLIQKWENRIK